MLSKFTIAWRAGLRALTPVFTLLLVLYCTGEIKNWHDLYSPSVLGAILAALGIKAGATFATAKSVEVKGA